MKYKQYYIYAYLDPRKPGEFTYINNEYNISICFNFEPFYIGKGTDRRDLSHLNSKFLFKKRMPHPFYDKLKKFKKNNIQPIVIRIIDNLTDENYAFILENKIIELIGIRDHNNFPGPLVNLNLGGTGGKNPSKEVRQKISNANKGKRMQDKNGNFGQGYKYKGENNHFFGQHHTQDSIFKMKRTYCILDNLNNYKIIHDLTLFCIENKCDMSNISAAASFSHLYKGIKIIKLPKNYTKNDVENAKEILKNISEKKKEGISFHYYKFISPKNEEFIVEGNPEKFCKENKLSINALRDNINNIVPPSRSNKKTPDLIRINTIGWKFIDLTLLKLNNNIL